ncbi:MAG: TetR/AcrR family transcriptional regulator [Rhodoglobus sp.]|nr:TetR/AcrR family transcriptional regulator [Rhodoglobus sp.]
MASQGAQVWLDAAYERFTDAGLSAIRVEALAREIGATKGSFYWHYANRGALVDAVMARWEHHATDDIIAFADAAGTPQERLAALFDIVGSRTRLRGGELTLYAEAEREGVLDAVARVTQRRIEYVAAILSELGFDDVQSRSRAAISLAVGVGAQQLAAGGWRGADEHLTAALLRMALAP